MSNILCIDPSYTLGWAIVQYDPWAVVDHGVVHTNATSLPAWEEMPRVRVYAAALWRIVGKHQPTAIISEIPTGSKEYRSSRAFGRMDGLLAMLATAIDVPLIPVSPFDVKNVAYNVPSGARLPSRPSIRKPKRSIVTAIHSFYYEPIFTRYSTGSEIEAVCDAIAVGVAGHRHWLSLSFTE